MDRIDNARARVTEVVMEPGVERPPYIRETDQIIVFLDDAVYSRRDAATGEVLLRERKAGEVLWHNKGEHAPALTNAGSTPYRALVIELRD
ncbi:hypothetical protein F183_A41690 [Bryobacterales bacterium F-183]|nr:hypothetical protein F183_A41690 [Bryobacterales bacterium F-183]